jgi:hypothetical protein
MNMIPDDVRNTLKAFQEANQEASQEANEEAK